MYKFLIRPVLFLFQPETIHHFIIRLIKSCFRIGLVRKLVRGAYTIESQGLEKEVFGLKFNNPVGLAAGFDKDATAFNELANFGFSFIEIGTITPVAQPGNEKPRLFRLVMDKGLINRMGFNNMGASEAAKKLSKRSGHTIVGGNIGKNTLTDNKDAARDYALCFKELYDYVDYFVVNVSCPNISSLSELQDRDELEAIVERLVAHRKDMAVRKPILVKISPDLNDDQIDDVISIIEQYSLDGIIATNTSIARSNLKTNPDKVARIGKGGLSGAPIRDSSTRIISYIHNKTSGKIPIIGVGGIMSSQDAIEKLDAGASLVQIYTGFIYDGPGLAKRINREILKRKLAKSNS